MELMFHYFYFSTPVSISKDASRRHLCYLIPFVVGLYFLNDCCMGKNIGGEKRKELDKEGIWYNTWTKDREYSSRSYSRVFLDEMISRILPHKISNKIPACSYLATTVYVACLFPTIPCSMIQQQAVQNTDSTA